LRSFEASSTDLANIFSMSVATREPTDGV